MISIEEIETWRKANNITRRKLADKMHYNYSGLCKVLSGKKRLTANTSRRIEDIMQAEQGSIKIPLPAEYEAKARAWAAQAHMQIDELLNALLEGMLKSEIKPRQ